jgi:hypothetical protein
VPYPQDDIVAVIDDYTVAAEAAAALRAGGVPADEVDVLDGGSFWAMARTASRRAGLLQRLSALVSRLFSDDAAYEDAYLDEASQGHAILMVRAERAETAECVCEVLGRYNAHDVRHYRRGWVEEIA